MPTQTEEIRIAAPGSLARILAVALNESPATGDIGTVVPSDSGGVASASEGSEAMPVIPGYQVTGRIGSGGMGVVYRATQEGTRREVALKVIGEQVASPQGRRRFAREVELTARLRHPGIVQTYESGLHRGYSYYSMELIAGRPIDAYVRQERLERRQVLGLFQKVCEAVQHAHHHGVVHRDLKPANILVSDDRQPHVLDFGLAHAVDGYGPGRTLSLSGELLGTLAYMAPEQALGEPALTDARADVYSLGVLLHQLLTGRLPREVKGALPAALAAVASLEVTRVRHLCPDLDRDLEIILLKALEREPSRRYQSPGQLSADIDNYLRGEPLSAEPPSLLRLAWKRVRRHRAVAAVATAAVLLLAGVSALAVQQVVVERDRAEQQSTENRTRLVAQMVRRGIQGLEQDAPGESLLWLAEAARLDPGGDQIGHRIRLAAAQQGLPRLASQYLADAKAWCFAFDPDGKAGGDNTLRMLGQDGQVSLGRREENQDVLVQLAHIPQVVQCSTRTRGDMALALDAGHALHLVDLARGQVGRKFQAPVAPVLFGLAPDARAVFAVMPEELRVWDLNSGAERWSAPIRMPVSWRLTAGGKSLVLIHAAQDPVFGEALVFDLTTGEKLFAPIVVAHDALVEVLGPDRLAVVGRDPFDVHAVLFLQHFNARGQPVGNEVTVPGSLPVGDVIAQSAIVATGEVLTRWDLATGRVFPAGRLARPSPANLLADPAAPGLLLATWSDGRCQLLDVAAGQALTPLLDHESEVHAWRVDAASHRLVTSTQGRVVRVWDYGAPDAGLIPIEQSEAVVRARSSPQGDQVLLVTRRGFAVWSVRERTMVLRYPTAEPQPKLGEFSPEGTVLALATEADTVEMRDSRSGVILATLDIQGRIDDLAFTPDGRRLVVLGDSLQVWDWNAGLRTATEFPPLKDVQAMAVAADGRRLAILQQPEPGSATVRVLDLETGAIVMPDQPAPDAVGVGLSTDGGMVCAWSPVSGVRGWSIRDGRPLQAPFPSVAYAFPRDGLSPRTQDDPRSPTVTAGNPTTTPASDPEDPLFRNFARAAVTPDLTLAAFADHQGKATVWDLAADLPMGPSLATLPGSVLLVSPRRDWALFKTEAGTLGLYRIAASQAPLQETLRTAQLHAARTVDVSQAATLPLSAAELQERWSQHLRQQAAAPSAR